MKYKLMHKIEDVEHWTWTYSNNGGETVVVITTPAGATAPDDLFIRRMAKVQAHNDLPSDVTSDDFSDAIKKNAKRKSDQAAERLKSNKSVLKSYRIK
jgi:hypothetical protein